MSQREQGSSAPKAQVSAEAEAQLALPGLVADAAAEWVWTEETGEEADVPDFVHATVMKVEVTEALAVRAGVYVDATVGGGGHSEAILEAHAESRVIALDRDQTALDAARTRLERFGDRITFVKTPFGRIGESLGVEPHHLANGSPRMPTRQRIVTDVSHSIGREIAPADLEDRVLNVRGHP